MRKYDVLFVCIHNSARSQMAEAFLNQLGGDEFRAESAGLEPGKLNPNVVEVLKEIDINISANKTQSVFDLFKAGKRYDAVVTVCDGASGERCPVFPGTMRRMNWSFSDPSSFTGTRDEVMEKTRQVRDEVRNRILQFIDESHQFGFWI